jgi:hypothetical protein
MNVVILDEALRELREARDWYASQGAPAKGMELMRLVESESPKSQTPRSRFRATRNGRGLGARESFVGRSRLCSRFTRATRFFCWQSLTENVVPDIGRAGVLANGVDKTTVGRGVTGSSALSTS